MISLVLMSLCVLYLLSSPVSGPELQPHQFSLCAFLQLCPLTAFLQGHSIFHVSMLKPIGIQGETFQRSGEGLGAVAAAVPCAKACGVGLTLVSS